MLRLKWTALVIVPGSWARGKQEVQNFDVRLLMLLIMCDALLHDLCTCQVILMLDYLCVLHTSAIVNI